MPLYLVGGAGNNPEAPGGPGHRHHAWETPMALDAENKVFKVSQGKYDAGHLEVGLSAVPDGEIGFTSLQSPLNFIETSPSDGVFTLNQALPDGWLIRARYIT